MLIHSNKPPEKQLYAGHSVTLLSTNANYDHTSNKLSHNGHMNKAINIPHKHMYYVYTIDMKRAQRQEVNKNFNKYFAKGLVF